MQQLSSHADLLDAAGSDPWVRWAVPDPLVGEAWEHEGVALVERVGARRGLWVLPLASARPVEADGHAVRSALRTAVASGLLERLGTASVSVVQQHAADAHAVLELGDGGDWEWMWTATAPPVPPSEGTVVELDDTVDAAEILDFSHGHNPRVWTQVGTGLVHEWVGLRGEDGALLAVAGAEREASGVAHLAGIVTHSAHRGRGLGRCVTAYLTRRAVLRDGVCTLGVFSDNATALGLYRSLGYATARAWHSRRL